MNGMLIYGKAFRLPGRNPMHTIILAALMALTAESPVKGELLLTGAFHGDEIGNGPRCQTARGDEIGGEGRARGQDVHGALRLYAPQHKRAAPRC